MESYSCRVYRELGKLRDYGFKDQIYPVELLFHWITRSALSIASNIAEGYERDSCKERIRFLSYAKGSCGELRTQVYIGMEASFIDRETGRAWAKEAKELSRMLYSLMQYLKTRT